MAIIAKRANQISAGIKRELDAKLQDFSIPQDNLEETFENREQIEISRQYERLPKPSLMARRRVGLPSRKPRRGAEIRRKVRG